MSEPIPQWADHALSVALPDMRAAGEGSALEYKREFPKQISDLGKEIAGFASSGGGTILLGVDDNGDLIGLDGALELPVRDSLLLRVEGICNGNIKPSITPSVKFAVEQSRVVMAIVVPSGSQPIYYSNHIPYVRHISSSRPAEPHEVVERVLERATRYSAVESSNEIPYWIEHLASALLPVLIYGAEVEQRMIEPWLGQWMAEFRSSASLLRELLTSQEAPEQLSAAIEGLSMQLDEIANFRMRLGSGVALNTLIAKAVESSVSLWSKSVADAMRSVDRASDFEHALSIAVRKLNNIAGRGVDLVNAGRTKDLQDEVAEVGRDLLRATFLYARDQTSARTSAVRQAARGLHLIETVRLYMDGGRSYDNLLAHIGKLRDELLNLASDAH